MNSECYLCLTTVRKCSPVFPPAMGHMTCVDPVEPFSYGSWCNFTCKEGYSLTGDKVLSCLTLGQWSKPTPTCAGVSQTTLLYHKAARAFWIEIKKLHALMLKEQCFLFSSGTVQQSSGSTSCLSAMPWPYKQAQLHLNMHCSVWRRIWSNWYKCDKMFFTG